jgi:hypothetical protein
MIVSIFKFHQVKEYIICYCIKDRTHIVFRALAAAPTFPGCFVSIKTNFVLMLVSGLTEDA